jgi:hypothetical protein
MKILRDNSAKYIMGLIICIEDEGTLGIATVNMSTMVRIILHPENIFLFTLLAIG